ncbi:hypothetical protein J6590_019654 [Homalodisca vitripennis]|nr:hypothetical protein J6590_019654 [Homalodisca vitripennis]
MQSSTEPLCITSPTNEPLIGFFRVRLTIGSGEIKVLSLGRHSCLFERGLKHAPCRPSYVKTPIKSEINPSSPLSLPFLFPTHFNVSIMYPRRGRGRRHCQNEFNQQKLPSGAQGARSYRTRGEIRADHH